MRLTTFITPFWEVDLPPSLIWNIEHSRNLPKGNGRDFYRSWGGRGLNGWYTHTWRNRGNTWPASGWGNGGHWCCGPRNWTKISASSDNNRSASWAISLMRQVSDLTQTKWSAYPQPKTMTELKWYLGMVNYLRWTPHGQEAQNHLAHTAGQPKTELAQKGCDQTDWCSSQTEAGLLLQLQKWGEDSTHTEPKIYCAHNIVWTKAMVNASGCSQRLPNPKVFFYEVKRLSCLILVQRRTGTFMLIFWSDWEVIECVLKLIIFEGEM